MVYLHHILVNFPVALSVTAAFAQLIGWLKESAFIRRLGRALTYVAAAVAIPTALAGLLSSSHVIELGGNAPQIARHRTAALVAVGALIASAATSWSTARHVDRRTLFSAVLAALGAAVAVGVAAHFGGDMLHPGLAPWSHEQHQHGGARPCASESADADAHHEQSPAEASATSRAPVPSASVGHEHEPLWSGSAKRSHDLPNADFPPGGTPASGIEPSRPVGPSAPSDASAHPSASANAPGGHHHAP